jgi:excisionase family DNA binding protein
MATAPIPLRPYIKMYSVKGASEQSDLARSTLYNFIREGKLKTVKVGGRRLIPDSALRELLQIGESSE